jgi:hypothetical protein
MHTLGESLRVVWVLEPEIMEVRKARGRNSMESEEEEEDEEEEDDERVEDEDDDELPEEALSFTGTPNACVTGHVSDSRMGGTSSEKNDEDDEEVDEESEEEDDEDEEAASAADLDSTGRK